MSMTSKRMTAIAGVIFGAVAFSASSASALTINNSFDSQPPSPPAQPVNLAGNLTVSDFGSGSCSAFSGSGGSSALCGNFVNSGADPGSPAVLTVSGIDFTLPGTISFQLGSFVNPGADFEAGQDFIQITAGGVVVAFFEVINSLTGNQVLASDDALVGGSAGSPVALSASLLEFSIDTQDIGSTETNGDLEFAFFSTSVNEFLAIDELSVEVVPLPASGFLILGGLGALAWMGRRRKELT
ncbi:MAG: VPLPA-CTERM sorting domain-containing protein [Pseudomonadota bacterium]